MYILTIGMAFEPNVILKHDVVVPTIGAENDGEGGGVDRGVGGGVIKLAAWMLSIVTLRKLTI